MHHRSLRCGSVFLFVLAAGCGGGDFVSGRGGKGGTSGVHEGRDASSGAVTGSGGAESGGAGGRSSSSGGRSGSGGSASGGTSSDGGRQGTGATDAGAGGANGGSGAANDGGGGAADGGGSGTAGGGTAGTGGKLATGGTSSGGASGGGAGGSPDCTNPTTWYLDADQDGYGSTATPPIVSCVPPPGHFAKVGNDCNDSNDMVHPQLTPPEVQYFSKPYQTASGVDSYDYDCSGHEEGDPSQQKAAAMCPAASLGTCGGSGYLAVSTGNRVAANGYCGSKSFRTCMNVTAFCTAQDVMNYSVAYRCK
jgi:hypothetical protein